MDEIWDKRREHLVNELRRAAIALLDHTGASSCCVELQRGSEDEIVAAGFKADIAEQMKPSNWIPYTGND